MNRGKKIMLSKLRSSYWKIGCVILVFFMIIVLIEEKKYILNNLSDVNVQIIRFVMMLLSIIITVVLFSQYLAYKKESAYITFLLYFNFSTELVFKSLLGSSMVDKGYGYTLYFSIVFRVILTFFIIRKLSKKEIMKNKEIAIIIYTLITFLTGVIDLSIMNFNNTYIVQFYYLAVFAKFMYIFIIGMLVYRERDILLFSLLINIAFLTVSNIFELYIAIQGHEMLLKVNFIMQFLVCIVISFIVLIVSLVKNHNLLKESANSVDRKMSIIEDNIKELILILNENLDIEYASSSLKKLLEYSKEEILGENLSYITTIDINDCFHEILSQAVTTKQAIKLKLRDKNGNLIEMGANIKELESNTSSFALFIYSMKDEVEIEKLKGELYERRAHEELNKEFYADLTHELRTPVNIMYSSIQLLEHKKVSVAKEDFIDYYNKYGEIMKKNSLIMLKLINDLIDNTKIESGFTKGEFNNYDIVSVIENITMLSIPYLERKNITLTFDTEFEEHFVKCDPNKIERIMLNLLSNAAKYTEEGGFINVNLEFDKNFVKIIVEDSGVGIPDNMQSEIFKKFEQVKDRIEKKLGSGIGLALVKSLVDIHNGFISLKSKLGEGSTFIISLPNILVEDKNGIEECSYDSQNKGDLTIEFCDLK